eukprot:scaffold14789_cov72-Cylindrotheca_fusiformis.AAC.2
MEENKDLNWILSRVACGSDGRTGFEKATGQTPDISEDLDFEFYDPVLYITNPRDEEAPKLGRWIGLAAHVVSTSSVQHIAARENEDGSNMKDRLSEFDTRVKERLKNENHMIPGDEDGANFGIRDVEVAEYAVANKIEEEPAFKWWVPYVLKKRNRILSKVKSKYWRTTHKFGIELPHSVEEAYEIDKRTGTLHWTKAIEKEMKKISSLQAFEKVEGITPDGLRKDAI